MNRLLAVCLTVLLGLALAGCGVSKLIDLIPSGGDDNKAERDLVRALTREWSVNAYNGAETGAVVVPPTALMVWDFRADGNFVVVSDQPVAIGPNSTRRYADSGKWRVLRADGGTLGLTLGARAGQAIPEHLRQEVTATYRRESSTQVTITTSALGPGSVTYTLNP